MPVSSSTWNLEPCSIRMHTCLVGENREILTDFWKALEACQDELGL